MRQDGCATMPRISNAKLSVNRWIDAASNRLVAYCEGRGLVSERLFGQKEILLERR